MEVRNSSMFLEPEERIMAVLGKSYLFKFLAHGVPGMGFCVVTDRRMYFQGKSLYKENGVYREKKEEHVIEVGEVIGSGFASTRLSIVFFLAILLVVVAMGGSFLALNVMDIVCHYHFGVRAIAEFFGVFLVLALAAVPVFYYFSRYKIFEIEYSGGKIAFLTSYYPRNEIMTFQRNLHSIPKTSRKL